MRRDDPSTLWLCDTLRSENGQMKYNPEKNARDTPGEGNF